MRTRRNRYKVGGVGSPKEHKTETPTARERIKKRLESMRSNRRTAKANSIMEAESFIEELKQLAPLTATAETPEEPPVDGLSMSELKTKYAELRKKCDKLIKDHIRGNRLEYNELVENHNKLVTHGLGLNKQNIELKKKHSEIVKSYNELSKKYSELLEKYHKCYNKESELPKKYNELLEKFRTCDNRESELIRKYNELARKYNNRESELLECNNRESELVNKYNELVRKESELVNKYNELVRMYNFYTGPQYRRYF